LLNNPFKGDVYSWGRGAAGRLGLASEEDVAAPKGNIFFIYFFTIVA